MDTGHGASMNATRSTANRPSAPAVEECDTLALGSGGGLKIALGAADRGQRVVLVEQGPCGGTLDDLLDMIFIHPALPEIVREAARDAQRHLEAP